MQYAWLDYDEGTWILITNTPNYEERKWVNEDLALEELKKEGWTINGPISDELSDLFYGYALNRLIH